MRLTLPLQEERGLQNICLKEITKEINRMPFDLKLILVSD